GDAGGVLGPWMVRAVDSLVDCKRGAPGSKRFRGAIRHQQQARIVALIALRQRMTCAEGLVAARDSTPEQRLRLVRLPQIAQQPRKVANPCRNIGMLGAKPLLPDCYGALIERPRPRKIALGTQQAGEIVEVNRGVGVLRAEHLFVDCQRALIEGPRRGKVALL